jgi:hypothetical protein
VIPATAHLMNSFCCGCGWRRATEPSAIATHCRCCSANMLVWLTTCGIVVGSFVLLGEAGSSMVWAARVQGGAVCRVNSFHDLVFLTHETHLCVCQGARDVLTPPSLWKKLFCIQAGVPNGLIVGKHECVGLWGGRGGQLLYTEGGVVVLGGRGLFAQVLAPLASHSRRGSSKWCRRLL